MSRLLRVRPIGDRRRGERGAMAVAIALITCFMLIPIAALAVDIGVQRVARRDAQSDADIVALDLSRQLDGRPYAVLNPLMQGLANQSLARNNVTGMSVSVALGNVNTAAYNPSSPYAYFTPITTGVPSAVEVTITGSVSFSLRGGSGTVSRSAIGTALATACYDLGSYAAAISSGDSTLLAPLNGLLGLNLSLISYQGLAGANVTLAGLAADSNIGSVSQLFSGNITLDNFTAAAISVLNSQNNPGNAVAISALQTIRASGINLSKKVNIANMLSVQQTDNAALASNMNVLDLISGAIQVANGAHAVSISNLNVAGITGGITVTQGIQHRCGVVNDASTIANASQITASLNAPLTFPTGSSVLGLTVSGNVSVAGGIGNAKGQLVGPPPVTCNAGTTANPDTYQVNVSGGLLGLGVAANVTLNGSVSTGLLGGLVDSLLGAIGSVKFNNVTISLGAGDPGTSTNTQSVSLQVPQNALNTSPRGTPKTTGSGTGLPNPVQGITTATAISGSIVVHTNGILGIIGAKDTTVSLTYGPVAGLISTLLGTLNSTLTSVVNNTLVTNLNALLVPLSKLLGVNAAGADVYSEYRPACNGAKLIG